MQNLWKIAIEAADLSAGATIAAYLTSASGTLLTNTTVGGIQALDVYTTSTYAEDSVAASGALGAFVLGIRRDTTGSNASAGDYTELQTWSNGELKTVDIVNASVLQQQLSITTTAAALPTTPLAGRKRLLIQNVGSASVWIGSSTVTTSGATTGIEVPKSGYLELDAGPACAVYARAGSGTVAVTILEAA